MLIVKVVSVKKSLHVGEKGFNYYALEDKRFICWQIIQVPELEFLGNNIISTFFKCSSWLFCGNVYTFLKNVSRHFGIESTRKGDGNLLPFQRIQAEVTMSNLMQPCAPRKQDG